MSQREEILSLLNGQDITSTPVFSGLIHITASGLQSEGLLFHEVHQDARKMARCAAEGIPVKRYVLAAHFAILRAS
jgi:hypothetical protein